MKKIYFLFAVGFFQSSYCVAQSDSSRNFYAISKAQNEYYNKAGNDKPGYKQFKRWEWYYSTRIGEGGKLLNNFKLNQAALGKMNSMSLKQTNMNEVTTGAWSQIGPASVSSVNKGIGRVNRIAFHPTNPNILYVAGATGGLWITQDGGSNWFSYSEGIPNMSLSGVAVDHNNPNIIYILTGDADDGANGGADGYGKTSTGVLKSYDGGFTWHYTGLKWLETNNVRAYKLIMHPTNPSILFVASNLGIFRTTDGGTSWTNPYVGDTFYDLEFNPADPSMIYASGTTSSDVIVLRSGNTGQTFSNTFTTTRVSNGNNRNSANRSALGVSAANSNYVYLLLGPATAAGSFHGFYRSADNATSFTLRTSTPNILGGSSYGSDKKDQEGYDLAIAVNSTNIGKVASGGIRLWTTTNGGTSFTFQNDDEGLFSYYHADIHDLAYHPLNSNIMFMCCDGGVYRSDDDGDNWYALNNNLQLTQYYKISINPSTGGGNENVIIGGTQDNGTNKRGTGGGSGFSQIYGSDGMDCFIDPDDINRYVVSVQNGKFYYSTNAGSTFEFVCNATTLMNVLNLPVDSFWVTPVAEITGNSTQFVMGYSPAVLATRVTTGIYTFTNLGLSGETFVKTARGNADRIYLGTNKAISGTHNYVYSTVNAGSNWNIVYSASHSAQPVTDLAFAPTNGNRMWLTFGGYGSTKKVMYTANGGNNGGSWTDITGSLPNVPINCIVYDNTSGSIDAIYIGTDIGVFYRDNNLGDWIPFSNGLPVIEVTDLEIHEGSGLLRAGTYGRGMWETSLYSSCPANITLNTSNTSKFMPYYFQASQSVNSTAHHAGAGADVYYKAGTELILNPGFIGSAAGGNQIKVFLGPCGGGVPLGRPANQLRGLLIENEK